LRKEISPAATAGIIAVVVAILGAVGYFAFFKPKDATLSPEDQQKAKQTAEQQYKQFYSGPGGRPQGAGPPRGMPGMPGR
jgi:hypothetical protein